MTDNKSLIKDYLQALSGKPKTPEILESYVADEGLAKHIADVEAAFPNYEIIAEDILAERKEVVVRGVFKGVHRGPFAGMEPTGKSVSAGLIIIYRIEDGLIVEHWMEFDRLGLMQQLQEAAATITA